VELYRKVADKDWDASVLTGQDDLVRKSLRTGELYLSLNTIYEGYDPSARVKEEQATYGIEYEKII
jgi:hypothetical protein